MKKITFSAIKKTALEKGLSFYFITSTATALLCALHLIIFFLFNGFQEPKYSAQTDGCDNYKKKDIKQTHYLLLPLILMLSILYYKDSSVRFQIVDKLMNNVTDKSDYTVTGFRSDIVGNACKPAAFRKFQGLL